MKDQDPKTEQARIRELRAAVDQPSTVVVSPIKREDMLRALGLVPLEPRVS